MIFAAAIFACVLSIGIVVVADESETAPNTDAQQTTRGNRRYRETG